MESAWKPNHNLHLRDDSREWNYNSCFFFPWYIGITSSTFPTQALIINKIAALTLLQLAYMEGRVAKGLKTDIYFGLKRKQNVFTSFNIWHISHLRALGSPYFFTFLLIKFYDRSFCSLRYSLLNWNYSQLKQQCKKHIPMKKLLKFEKTCYIPIW